MELKWKQRPIHRSRRFAVEIGSEALSHSARFSFIERKPIHKQEDWGGEGSGEGGKQSSECWMSGKVKEATLLLGLAVFVSAYLPEESRPRVQGNQAAEGVAWAHAVARLWPPPTNASSGLSCGSRCGL